MRKRISGKRDSFTLIELLVVIVIILILTGLFLPSLGKTRENARQARCKNNLKNLHTAVMSYSYETSGYMPSSSSTERFDNRRNPRWQQHSVGWVHWTEYSSHNDDNKDATKPGYTKWWGPDGIKSIQTGALWEFTGRNMKVYLCPTFARPEYSGTRDPENEDLFDEDNNPVVRSYAMNSRVSGNRDSKLGDMEASRTLLFADHAHTKRPEGEDADIADRCILEDSSAGGDTQRRERHDLWAGSLEGGTNSAGDKLVETIGMHHKGKGVVVFVDGHVETLTWQDTYAAWNSQW